MYGRQARSDKVLDLETGDEEQHGDLLKAQDGPVNEDAMHEAGNQYLCKRAASSWKKSCFVCDILSVSSALDAR